MLLERARQRPENRERIETILAENDVPYAAVERAHRFYGEALTWLDERVEAELAERVDGYGAGFTDGLPAERLEIELRDPERGERDEFTAWAEDEAGYDGDCFRTLGGVGSAVENALDRVGIEREAVCAATGVRFEQWYQRDHTAFFRELTLEPSDADYRNPEFPWRAAYNASFVMYNCIPAEAVQATLEEFGGGILMSATLEPIDIFEAVSGLAALSTRERSTQDETMRDGSTQDGSMQGESTADGDDGAAGGREPDTAERVATGGRDTNTAGGRTVERRSYELQFPPENRESWLVDVMAFTARNRGEPIPENRNRTRERYAYVAREIARSHGNILLCYPNYAEATWAAGRLREAIDKPVFCDESSDHETTRSLKTRFVEDDHAVLVTSTRGTLTEGVDFDGESLHTCAVFGVPLVNIGSPRVQAVKHAYGDRFGEDNAFEYALTVPALRQVRQAIGRVIRGPDERGVRLLVGERYVPGRPRSVTDLLSPQEQREFSRLTPEYLAGQFEAFWDD
jgi:DNA excision repair protein ERCC-2